MKKFYQLQNNKRKTQRVPIYQEIKSMYLVFQLFYWIALVFNVLMFVWKYVFEKLSFCKLVFHCIHLIVKKQIDLQSSIKCNNKSLPRKFHIGYFCADSKQRRKCTWGFFCIHIICPQLFSGIEFQSRTCCAVASLPFFPAK